MTHCNKNQRIMHVAVEINRKYESVLFDKSSINLERVHVT